MSIEIEDIQLRVKKTIVSSLDLEIDPLGIGDNTLLFASALIGGLELDSLAAIDIIVGLSTEFGIEFDEIPRESFKNVTTLSEFISWTLDASGRS
jgi:acyl carrier protein